MMRPLSEVFLADAPVIATGESGQPETVKLTPEIARVTLLELELTYIHNPVVFNSVNKIVQMIMSADHEIVAKDKKVQEYFTNFTANIGNSGSDITWEELLSAVFQHQCVYGRSFVENIFNKRGNRIVDWDIVDPKNIDYAKDANDKIVTDRFGKPVGYFQKLPWGQYFEVQENPLPPKVIKPHDANQAIFLPPERLAQLKLFTIGDGFYPVGIVEPIYKDSLRKMNIKEALANAIYRHGFPIIWAKLGDLNHEPTPQQIQNMLQKLKDINFKQEIATPYYYELNMLESKKAEKLREHLDYFNEEEVTGMGIPESFATGKGSEGSYASLTRQSSMFQLTLRDIINRTVNSIQKYMFKPMAQLEGFKEIPTIRWDLVGTDELDKKAKRIVKYVEAGLLVPDEKISNFIKKSEQLDE